MKRSDPDQSNLIDGTILAFDPTDGGAYVTFVGINGSPIIAAIDFEDLERLGGAVLSAARKFNPDLSQEDQTRITSRGIEILRDMLSGGGQ